jgi:hypothetical protein
VAFAGAHAYVYTGVPPESETADVPLQSPKHNTLELVVTTCNAAGSVIVNVAVLIHPKESVVVTVYVAGQRFAQDCELHPPGAHRYVYEPDPPLGTTVAVPLQKALQETLFTCAIVVDNGVGAVIQTICVVVQPFASTMSSV